MASSSRQQALSNWDDLPVQLLPTMLRDWVRLIGIGPAMKMVQAYGGRRVYIPKHPHGDHPLAKLIGLDNLVQLSRDYGLEDHHPVPKAERALRYLRNQKIRADYGRRTTRELALEYDLTERSIWQIVSPVVANEQTQDELFS